MAFRGFGDDALKVKADKREAALKAAQIAASERASMRSANVQMAGLQENARQADMANQRAGEQLAAGNERFTAGLSAANERLAAELEAREAARADKMALESEGLALKREGMEADEAYRRDVMAESEEQRQIDLELKLEEQSRHERQLQLNESTAARLEQEWQQKQAVQEEIKNAGKATHLAVMRAAVRADGPVDQVFLNAWNSALNVGPGEPGYVKQITAVRDPKTQENYGVGFLSVGQEGEDVYTVKNPADIMPLLRASMSPDAWDKWSYDTLNQRKSAGIDATSAAILKEKEKGKLELSAKQALEIAKVAQGLAGEMDPKTDQANLDKTKKITSGALDAATAAMQGPQPEQPAPKFSLEDKALFTQAMTDADGDRDKAKELYKAAKAKQAEVAKRRAGGDETPADEAAGGAAPAPAAAEKAEAAPEAKNLAASQALRRQNATKSTPAKAQAQPEATPEVAAEEKDVRSKFFPPVRRSDEPLGDYNQKFEQWVNDNPWYRALQEAISPRTKESSLLPPVRKANETPAAHNARFERWRKDNPLMRFFEGLKSEPGSKPDEKWDAVVKKS